MKAIKEMEERREWRYFGREFTSSEAELIREIVGGFGSLSVNQIALTICELLDWKRPSGGLKGRECREMLEELRDRGELKLPELRKMGPSGPRVVAQTERGEARSELTGRASEYRPVVLKEVKAGRGGESGLWRELIERHHYLKYRAPVGATLRYLIYSGQRPGEVLGCMLWSSPAWKIEVRDRWIGWDGETRARNLQLIISNSRFLILPWVRVEHLASMVLGQCARQVGGDWERKYGYRPLMLETMVDARRFRGTCYRAANWIDLGMTKGRGRMDRGHEREKEEGAAVKQVLVYPLCRNAPRRLCRAAAPNYREPAEDE